MSQPELPTRYNFKEAESKWYSIWESKGYFRPKSDREGKKFRGDRYVIVIPPPNVTGILHMGHALNNSIQDILVRWRRMQGRDALWIPGVDHAGIATQNVVEKKLAKEKKSRHDLGRENFLKEVWKWKEENGSTITRQLRSLGASCDWTRERFTMDEGLTKSVRECFVTLYERGLIYRGNYIINWCPRCQTALSDEEAAHKDVQGAFYHIKYPIKNTQGHIVVATTRPETMLGDMAVAVNPNDERYKHLIGKMLILPLMNREIPVIADEFVDPEFGTGMVKVTPAHDPNDFEMGKRHNLKPVNVMNLDGKINELGGQYNGLDRFAARKKIIEDLESLGLFVEKKPHAHSVGHCYRCDTVVEPYLSKQWFVKMKPLADKALEAHKQGKTKFYPDRWTKVYTNWLEGIRDWCISRQIWWGHRVPAWYCVECYPHLKMQLDPPGGKLDPTKPMPVAHLEFRERPIGNEEPFFCHEERPSKCPNGHTDRHMFVQDPDVLDTWFSSWLWPFSTLGWPEKTEDLKYFYETTDLVTAPEIIFFWVARMIMSGLEFLGEVPFHNIYIHGTVRAQGGLKMSKSLGNVIDPIEIIEEMSADALRFSMIMLSAQDVYLSREKFEVGRNFTNKIWNASRFVLMNLQDFTEGSLEADFDSKTLSLESSWILSRFDEVCLTVDKHLSVFNLAQASSEIYHFIWNDFCDWYIELAKATFTGPASDERLKIQKVLFHVLEKTLRLLHPFAPFISEEIWQTLKAMAKDKANWPESIMLAKWPGVEAKNFRDSESELAMDLLQKAVGAVRDFRNRFNVPPAQTLKAVVTGEDKNLKIFDRFWQGGQLAKMTRLESFKTSRELNDKKKFLGSTFPEFAFFIEKEGVVDPVKERSRLEKKITDGRKWIESAKGRLSNENFVKNAPPEIIECERAKLADTERVLKADEELLVSFQD